MEQPQFIETVRTVDGEVLHLAYHQARFDRTRAAHHASTQISLSALLSPSLAGTQRCRILYDRNGVIDVHYQTYEPRTILSLQAVEDNNITYTYKSADRSALKCLFEQRRGADDVAVIKNGFVCDTTIANLIFFDGVKWLTPVEPLLKGTTRARLLEGGTIQEAAIKIEEIPRFKKVAIINAMLGFYEIKNGIILEHL